MKKKTSYGYIAFSISAFDKNYQFIRELKKVASKLVMRSVIIFRTSKQLTHKVVTDTQSAILSLIDLLKHFNDS